HPARLKSVPPRPRTCGPRVRNLMALAALVTALATAAPTLLLGTFFARTGDVHRQRPALKILVVKLLDRLVRFFGRAEFHEREAARFAGHLVQHEIHRCNNSSP